MKIGSKVSQAMVLVGLVSLAAGCSSDNDATVASVDSLNWSSCEGAGQLECTELEVPMDYSDADGEQITVALIRKPASGSVRRGSLLFNPGGPGGSGVEMIRLFDQIGTIPTSILDTYDLVGFDPRGVGSSTPVDCAEFGLEDFGVYPADDDAVRALHAQIVSFSAACSQKYGGYLQQLGSPNVVRDMEEIRIALGDDKLNFIGYSYGTRLAALYLQQYPASSGRIVLDASIHPDSSVDRLLREALPAQQSNLRLFFEQCLVTDSSCDVDLLMTKFLERVKVLAADGSEAAQDELNILGEIVFVAIEEPEFGELAAAPIASYLNSGDFTELEAFVMMLQQLESEGDGEDESSDEDSDTAQIAILCADDGFRPTEASLIQFGVELNQISDVFAEAALAQSAVCAGWPEAIEPLPLIGSSTAPLSLVIGGTTDAQTPLAWSEAMAQAIGGVYIRSEHLGHTTVFNDESACIDDLVEQFLLDGLVPVVMDCPLERNN